MDSKFNPVYFNHLCSTYFKLPPRKLNKCDHVEQIFTSQNIDLKKLIKDASESNSSQVSIEGEISLVETMTTYTVIMKVIPHNGEFIVNINDFSIEKQLFDKYKLQIQELKETHHDILLADRLTALGELISGIGHEVSTPLTVVSDRMNRIDMCLLQKDFDGVEKYIVEIKDAFNRIIQIIGNMQSYTSNEEDDIKVCSLADIVNKSMEFINTLDILKGIKLEVNAQSDSLVLLNPSKMEQVVINIVKNSLDALRSHDGKSPKIIVNVEHDPDLQQNKIVISDNGPGIPAEIQDKIFEMFFTTKELGEGTGLGLSISQKIVKAYHGDLLIGDSESEGASFTISLPTLELSSFAQTNEYLKGTKEAEDPKLLIVGESASELNSTLSALQKEAFVLILSSSSKEISSLEEFFAPSLILYSGKSEIKSNAKVIKISHDEKKEKLIELIKKELK